MTKQRTTFRLDSLDAIDTDNLILNEHQVTVPGSVFKRRQDRLVLDNDDLSLEIQQLFDKIYEFRIQWSSQYSKPDVLFQNFAQKGVSIDLVPSVAEYEPIFDSFGKFTKDSLNINFNHSNIISTPVSANFHSFTDLKPAIIQRFLRSLNSNVDLTSFIDDIDIVWKEKKLIVTWTSPPAESIINENDGIRKEIAFFQSNELSFDLDISGIRTILSKDQYLPPTKTLLFIKPRHLISNHKINFEILKPIGLHPTLKISNLSNLIAPNDEQCSLFIYSTIEKSLIFDKYQYDKNSLLLINSWGENDLEAPIWKVQNFGSNQLFQIIDSTKDIEIKYHSRYLKPSQENHFKFITPKTFWACDSSNYIDDYEQIASNPFDGVGLGYESLFEDTTIFYHYDNNPSILEYTIPTADKFDSKTIELITLISILIGSLYILRKLYTIIFSSIKMQSNSKKDK